MSNVISRRRFLLSGLAVSLGIPGCYKELADNTGHAATKDDAVITPPSTTSSNVRYYEKDAAEYERFRQPFNKRIRLSPKVIAVCLNEKGVQEAIQYARYYKLPVAIKSGGHSFEGYCLNDNGLVIELSQMNHMHFDPATGIFTAQPGCKLRDVYQHLYQHKRLLPAGSCGGVGLAGLTLGGGYGFFSRQFGLTCDSLQATNIVDGKGSLQSTKDNPELLWACRGGGNGNFGVVTSFTFNTHPAPTHFTSHRFKFHNLTPETATKAAEDWFSLMETLPNTCYSAFVLGHKRLTVLVTDTEESSSPELQTILNQLKALATKSYAPSKQPYLRALKRYEGRPDPLNFKNVSGGYYKDFSDLKAVFADAHRLVRKQRGALFQINTLGGAIDLEGKDSTAAYPHRGMKFLGEIQVYWEKPEAEPKAIASIQSIQALLRNAGINRHYRNYPDIDIPNWQTAYYAGNYERLQTIKRKLDPDNIFQHPQSVNG